jgi:hypothetical protein
MNDTEKSEAEEFLASIERTKASALKAAEDARFLIRLLTDNGYVLNSLKSSPFTDGHGGSRVFHAFEIRKFFPSIQRQD